jgi:hypothetical protein
LRRIYGLDFHIAMLVLTPNNIHILCGFVAKKSKKSGTKGHHHHHNEPTAPDCTLEWISPLQQQEYFNRLNTTNKNGALSLDQLNDNDWMEDIWKELLRSDLAYSRIALADVYSFFRRRHELKYTATEITDVMGYSVLYSCESVKVRKREILFVLRCVAFVGNFIIIIVV